MDRRVTPAEERRTHTRSWFVLGHARVAARLRTGPPLRVLNVSPDGMLVESPARLLPGRQVELVLQSGTTREQARWLVVHSRVGCIRGRCDLRYRAGLRRASGSNYSRAQELRSDGNRLLGTGRASEPAPAENAGPPRRSRDGTGFESAERS
jgi:hypothetical protein